MKTIYLSLFLLLLVGANSYAQASDTTETHLNDKEVVYIAVEKPTHFRGGQKKINKYLDANLHYPAQARQAGVSGVVFVTFVVDKTGKVKDVRIAKGIGYGCDEEAHRLVRLMPDWVPAMQNGKPVSMHYGISVRFDLYKHI